MTSEKNKKWNASKEAVKVVIAIFIYLIGAGFLWVFKFDLTLNATLIILQFISIISFYVYWSGLSWNGSEYSSFGGALIVFNLFNKTLSLVNLIGFGYNESQWPPTVLVTSSISSIFIRGELITQIGYLLSVYCWRAVVKTDQINLKINSNYDILGRKIIIIIYCVALVAGALSKMPNFQSIEIIKAFIIVGIAIIYIYANSFQSLLAKISVAVFLGAPFAWLAIDSGMKEELLLPFLPSVVIMYSGLKNISFKVVLTGILIVFFSASNLYATFVRTNIWDSTNDISKLTILSNVVSQINSDSLFLAIETSFLRYNYFLPHAVTMALLDNKIHPSESLFFKIPTSLVPRFIWPEKPILAPGFDQQNRIAGGNLDINERNTNTQAGFYTEIYLYEGVLGLFILSCGFGYAIGKLQLIVLRNLPLMFSKIFCFYLFYISFRIDENSIITTFGGVLTIIMALCLIAIFFRIIQKKRSSLRPAAI